MSLVTPMFKGSSLILLLEPHWAGDGHPAMDFESAYSHLRILSKSASHCVLGPVVSVDHNRVTNQAP